MNYPKKTLALPAAPALGATNGCKSSRKDLPTNGEKRSGEKMSDEKNGSGKSPDIRNTKGFEGGNEKAGATGREASAQDKNPDAKKAAKTGEDEEDAEDDEDEDEDKDKDKAATDK